MRNAARVATRECFSHQVQLHCYFASSLFYQLRTLQQMLLVMLAYQEQDLEESLIY